MPKRESIASIRARRRREHGAGLHLIVTGGRCCDRHGTFERVTQTSGPSPVRRMCWDGTFDYWDEVERRS